MAVSLEIARRLGLDGKTWRTEAGEADGSTTSLPRVESVPLHYTDFDPLTGDAPLYELQENERLIATWFNVTVAFDDTSMSNLQAFGPGGSAVGTSVSDSCTPNQTNAESGSDGLMGPVPGETGGGTASATFPFVRPSGAAVMLTAGFGVAPTGDGTQGTVIVNLLIATEA